VVPNLSPAPSFAPPYPSQFQLDFLKFTISDYDSKKVIFQVGKDSPPPADVSIDFSAIGEDMYRKIRYRFSEDVLRLPFIQTSLVFGVGQVEVSPIHPTLPNTNTTSPLSFTDPLRFCARAC
jgi:hypothetical protein